MTRSEKALTKKRLTRKDKKAVSRRIKTMKEKYPSQETLPLELLVRKKKSKIRSIYILKTDRNMYKIGVATDPSKRLKGVQTGCPTKVELIFSETTFSALKVESELHKSFDRCRVIGEWFRLNSIELVALKEEIKKRVIK